MKRPSLLLFAALMLALTGCLQMDRQTMVLVFPPGTQEVRGVMIYEGLHVQGDKANDVTRAKEELAGVSRDSKMFFLFNPFIMSSEIGKGDIGEARAARELLNKHVKISQGAFFQEKEDQLAYYQPFTIRDRDKFVTGLNVRLSAALAEWVNEELKKEEREGPFDKETVAKVRKAAGSGYAWVKLEPGRLSFTMPATPATVRALKREQLNSAPEALEWLADNPWSFAQNKDGFTVSLGVGDGEPITLRSPSKAGGGNAKSNKDLIAHAKTLKVRFNNELTAEKIIKEFLASGVAERKP